MHLDRSRVQGHRFKFDPNDLLHLQLLENTVQNAALGPPAHPDINVVRRFLAAFKRQNFFAKGFK
jgi:hypothetical protein